MRMAMHHILQRLNASVGISWTRLLKRGLNIDIQHCPHCGGDMKIIAAILEKASITKIIDHLGLPAWVPPGASAQILDLFVPTEPEYSYFSINYHHV